MDHVAILNKSWGLLEKIRNGEKKIESRWYKNRNKPWDCIDKGDNIYFKNSGEKVSDLSEVSNVRQFSDLNPKLVNEILEKYGKDLGIDNIADYYKIFKNKKYCILIFIKNPTSVTPFEINKKGYGMMSAWIVTEDINKIKL